MSKMRHVLGVLGLGWMCCACLIRADNTDAGTGVDDGGQDAGTLDGGSQDGGALDGGAADAGPLAISPAFVGVNPGGQQLFSALNGSGPYTWNLSINASGASLDVSDYVSMAAAPSLSGVLQWQQWGHSQPVVVRDNHGNHELFTFGSPGASSGKLHLLRSANQGDTWAWASPDSYAQSVNSDTNAGVMSVAQDSSGAVHILYFRSGFLDVAYYRVTLTYSGGAISGYSGLVGPIAIPGTYNGDKRGTIRVLTTASGADVLAVLVTASDPGNTRLQASMSITSTLTPTTASDWKSLGGTANSTTMVLDEGRAVGGSHDHNALFAQLGSTKDLWVFAGNVPAEPGPTTPTMLTRVRLTASGSTWTVGSLTDGSTSNAWLMGVEGSANYVWAMYGRYADGQVRFARVSSDGSYVEPLSSIPSPVADGRTSQTQFGVFSINPDETRIWAIYTRDPGPVAGAHWYDCTPTGAHWNGSSWQLRTDVAQGDTGAIAFAEGLGGSVGWDTGVVGLMTKTDGSAFNGPIRLATMRSPSGALDGGASVSSSALYTAGSTGGVTDAVTVSDATGASATATVSVP